MTRVSCLPEPCNSRNLFRDVSPVSERHTNKRKFRALLKFSKEVQVYQNVIHSMMIYDEKRYPAACVEPPVPRWVWIFGYQIFV